MATDCTWTHFACDRSQSGNAKIRVGISDHLLQTPSDVNLMDIGSRGVCLLPIGFDSGDFVSVREMAGNSASVFENTAEHSCVVVLCTNTAPTGTLQV